MKIDNRLDIIAYMFSLIISEKYDASINSLSDSCNLPIQQTRKCISALFQNPILLSHLSSTMEISDEDDDPLESAKLFLNKLVNGECDDANIYLTDMDSFTDEYLLLPVDPVEISTLRTAYPNLLENHMTSLFETKDSIDAIPPQILDRQDDIQNAIMNKKQIEFMYKSLRDGTFKIKCSPVEVIQNITSHILYVKDTQNNYYRLDRIKDSIKILKDSSDIDMYVADKYQKYFWGTEYKDHGEPVHVKIRISNETSNILEKIKRDTALRSKTCILYPEGDYYFYEDDILGIQDFRRWLRSYGSSLTIIQPQELIDDIVNGAQTALNYYRILP